MQKFLFVLLVMAVLARFAFSGESVMNWKIENDETWVKEKVEPWLKDNPKWKWEKAHPFVADGLVVTASNDFEDDDAKALLDLPDLKYLSMMHATKLTDAGMKEIAKVKTLEILDIRVCNALTDEGLTAIGTLPNLRILICNTPKATDRGIKELNNSTNLGMLIMNNIAEVTDEGILGLSGLVRMEDWGFSGNSKITDAGLQVLANYPEMKLLVLRGTGWTGADVPWEKMPKLKDCYFDTSSSISDAGIERLAKQNTVETLGISGAAKVTDVGATSLATMSKLKSLSIQRTGITAEGKAKIKAALPDCKVYDE